MIRRRKQHNLPLQARFYPMPGSAFIENSNDSIRVSLYGRQALGVASLEPGEIQVMLDRRLIQDDDLGLGQVFYKLLKIFLRMFSNFLSLFLMSVDYLFFKFVNSGLCTYFNCENSVN